MRKLTRLLVCLGVSLFPMTGTTLALDTSSPTPTPLIEQDTTHIEQDWSFLRGTDVYTGTLQSVYRISNPGGISGLVASGDELANYSVEILSQSGTSAEVRVTSHLYVDSTQSFPFSTQGLSDYLMPTSMAQSDDPGIMALAASLRSGCWLEGQVVDATIAWIRGHIDYDYAGTLPIDAVSVLANRQATCGGFMFISEALLRASGIPTRYVSGTATPIGFGVGEQGGWHGWIEVYYPDVGWVPCDPEASANYVDSAVIRGGFDQCGESGTVIERISHVDSTELLYTLQTPYDIPTWGGIKAASVAGWDRQPLTASPHPLFILDDDAPQGSITVSMESASSYDNWRLSEDSPWLSVDTAQGARGDQVTLQVNAMGYAPGRYETALILEDGQLLDNGVWLSGPATCSVSVDLIIMPEPLKVMIPIGFK